MLESLVSISTVVKYLIISISNFDFCEGAECGFLFFFPLILFDFKCLHRFRLDSISIDSIFSCLSRAVQ